MYDKFYKNLQSYKKKTEDTNTYIIFIWQYKYFKIDTKRIQNKLKVES